VGEVDADASGGGLPARLQRQGEQQFGVRRRGQPVVLGQLLLELARPPPGAAQRHDRIRWALAFRHRLEYVARGVERLVQWTGKDKLVWNCIECTHISNESAKATPQQVRAEVWMSLIRGSRGLIYFVHQFKPSFKEAALLDDPEMLAAVTAINTQIRELAPVLNGPNISDAVALEEPSPSAPIAFMAKQHQDTRYVFAVNLGNEPSQATFRLSAASDGFAAEAIGETRSIPVRAGKFGDAFKPYEVHLYRLVHAK